MVVVLGLGHRDRGVWTARGRAVRGPRGLLWMGMGLCRRIWCMGMGMPELGRHCRCGVVPRGEGVEEGVPSWLAGLFLLFLLLVCCRRDRGVPVRP